MNLLYILFVHFTTCVEAPCSYTKYMWFCLRHLKKPNNAMLAKLLRMAYYARTIKAGHHD